MVLLTTKQIHPQSEQKLNVDELFVNVSEPTAALLKEITKKPFPLIIDPDLGMRNLWRNYTNIKAVLNAGIFPGALAMQLNLNSGGVTKWDKAALETFMSMCEVLCTGAALTVEQVEALVDLDKALVDFRNDLINSYL